MEQKQFEQGARLKKLIKELKINQLGFAKDLGVAQSNISKMMNGERQISIEVLSRISNRYNVNLHWLITGNGNMFLGDEQETSLQVNEEQPDYQTDRLGAFEMRLNSLEKELKELKKELAIVNAKRI
jgi:transcriptional regulator with XRE-family HTH domain